MLLQLLVISLSFVVLRTLSGALYLVSNSLPLSYIFSLLTMVPAAAFGRIYAGVSQQGKNYVVAETVLLGEASEVSTTAK